MKKKYFAPGMEIVEIKVQQMLTTSLPTDSNTTVSDENDLLAPFLLLDNDQFMNTQHMGIPQLAIPIYNSNGGYASVEVVAAVDFWQGFSYSS